MIRSGDSGFFPLICGFRQKRNSMHKCSSSNRFATSHQHQKRGRFRANLLVLLLPKIVGLLQLEPETVAIEANTAFASLPQRQRGFSY
jgi:hypothetical protein